MNQNGKKDGSDPRHTEHDGFPRASSPLEQMRFIANFAMLAPSPFNTQPWRIRVTDNTLEVYPDLNLWLRSADPDGHDLVVSCGAAVANAVVALRHFGFATRVETFTGDKIDEKAWLVRLTVTGPHANDTIDTMLYYAIQNRHTARKPFNDRLIPQPLMADISAVLAQEHGADMSEVDDPERRNKVAALWDEIMDDVSKDKSRDAEVQKWIGTTDPQRKDGEPIAAAGIDQLHYHWINLTRGGSGLVDESRQRTRARIISCPRLVAISTSGDTLSDWVTAGMAMESALLRACSPGVQAFFLGQLTCRKEDRMRTREVLDLKGIPHVALCLGFSSSSPTTPRRPLSEVLLP